MDRVLKIRRKWGGIYSKERGQDFQQIIDVIKIYPIQQTLIKTIPNLENDKLAFQLLEKWLNIAAAGKLILDSYTKENTSAYRHMVRNMTSLCEGWFPLYGGLMEIHDYIGDVFILGERFRKERYLKEYMLKSFELNSLQKSIGSIYNEYRVKHGRPDLAIIGNENLYIELKVGNVTRKDIKQAIGYIERSKFHGVVIGNRVFPQAAELAKRSRISIYEYSITRCAPTVITYKLATGKPVDSINYLGGHELFLNNYDDYTKHWEWSIVPKETAAVSV